MKIWKEKKLINDIETIREKSYKIEKSKFPEDNKTHLVVLYSKSEHGYNYQRIYKGSYRECQDFIRGVNNEA